MVGAMQRHSKISGWQSANSHRRDNNGKAKAAEQQARVFCSSLADVFEEKPDQPEIDEWRSDLFELISSTPN